MVYTFAILITGSANIYAASILVLREPPTIFYAVLMDFVYVATA